MTNAITTERVLTMAEKSAIVNRTLGIDLTKLKNEALVNSLANIAEFTQKGRVNAWQIANEYANIVKNETFKEDYKSIESFCKQVGIAKSTMTQYVKAIDFSRNNSNLIEGEITVRRAYEYSKVDYPSYKAFLTINKITGTTDKDVQANVKLYNDFTSWLKTTKKDVKLAFNVNDIDDCKKVKALFNEYKTIIDNPIDSKEIKKDSNKSTKAAKTTEKDNVVYITFEVDGISYKVPEKVLSKYIVK